MGIHRASFVNFVTVALLSVAYAFLYTFSYNGVRRVRANAVFSFTPARGRLPAQAKGGIIMSILSDHWLDIIVAIVLVFSIWHGWRTGFMVGLFNLLSIPLGIVVAYFFAQGIAAATHTSPTLMYIIVFFATVIGVHIVGSLLRRTLRSKVPLAKGTDSLLGAIVSGAKAWVLLVLFLVVWGSLLNSSTIQQVACATTAVTNTAADTLSNWQGDYNHAVGHSVFAQVNSFVVPQKAGAQGCGNNSAGK
jgi:uncharacterized membrane protein required for colicin V production